MNLKRKLSTILTLSLMSLAMATAVMATDDGHGAQSQSGDCAKLQKPTCKRW